MAFPVFIFFLVSIVFTEGDPCEDYTKFPNEERRDTNYPLRTDQSRFSDRYLDETWYGSKLNITSVMPPRFVCGTYFPIWAKEVSDVTNDDGTVDVTMCIHVLENCSSSFVVKAKYCDSHVVYFLTRTPLDSVYCLGAQINVPTYTKTPVIEADLKVVNKLSNVSCNYEKHDNDDVYYTVYWYINDTYCYASSSHHWLDREKNNKLIEEAAMNECITTTSFNITCGVRLSYEDLPGGSVPVFGQPVFFDIKDYCVPNGECNEIGSKCVPYSCLVCSSSEVGKTWQIDPTCGAAVVFVQWCVMMMSVLIISVL